MESTFSELRKKQIINIVDGKLLGHITDLVIDDNCGKIIGLIVPGNKKIWGIFSTNENIFIPYVNICKIGEDVILVELYPQNNRNIRSLKVPKIYSTGTQID